MPSVDSERPFDCWNTDLNVFAVGGVADGDGSRQANLKGSAGTGVPAFLDREKKIGIRGRANRRPAECADSVCDARCGRRVDNNRYSVICVPASRLVNVDVRETSLIGLFCWTVGWWEVLVAWGEPHGQP